MKRIAILLTALLCACPVLLAQQSTIQGVVTDTTTAVIPGVTITITNAATGVSLTSRTNAVGFYSVPFLVPGTYSVKAEAEGFAPVTKENLKLDVNQTARADFALQVGTVAETVEVSVAAALINTETTTVGQVIDNKRIVELPLNGRNYLELARLTVGVAPAPGARTAGEGNFTALGARSYQTNILLDGVDNNSRASGGQLGFEAQNVKPSIDAVQEFKVVTNNNSAEYGFRMGAAVIVQTKSGTNEFHGTAYEFLRNDQLDANNFFANRSGQPKPSFRQNQFGGTLGGRLVKDRTFFFGSVEGTRVRRGETSITTVPTAVRKAGRFTDAGARKIFDPASTRRVDGKWVRDQFPGNAIPLSAIDPVARAVVDLYPEPNLSGTVNNHFFSGSLANNTNQYDARVDHNFSTNHRIFVRYSRRDSNETDPGPLPLPADGGLWDTTDLTSNSVVGNWNTVVSASANNELRVGYTKTDSILDIPWAESFNQRLGITGLPDLGDDNARGMTRFTPTGYSEVGSRSFWPNRNNLNLWHIADHFMKIQGRHVLKFGGEFRREYIFRRAARFARGQMAFNRAFTQDPTNRGQTGDGLADLLTGFASGGTIGNQNGETAIAPNWAFYFQDDWKISRKLTLNLGVRWDFFGRPSFDSPVSRFDFEYGQAGPTIIRPKDAGDCGCEQDWNNFAPRIGLAYQLTSKTVLRAGYGVYFGQPDAIAHDGDAAFFHQPPEFTEIGFPTDQLVQPALIVRDGFPKGLLPTEEIRENVSVKDAVEKLPNQYAHQWFFDLQRELPWDGVLTLSYIGSGTRHMVWTRDYNQPFVPGATSVKSRRPWPFYGGIQLRDPGGNASYNAFTAKAEKRFSQGLTFLASYTWSHTIDDRAGTLSDGLAGGGFRNSHDISLDRGNSAYDLRHNFVGSFVYDLPFGRGRALGSNWNPVANAVLGGWQLGGILFIRSGQTFSPLTSGNITNLGGQGYPDRFGEGTLPESQRTINRWFNAADFAIQEQFTIGNSGRNILFGPGFNSMDLKIGKNFYIKERARLEFRFEMFNFANHPSFGLPNSSIDQPDRVGQITSQAGAARQLQFGLKFVY